MFSIGSDQIGFSVGGILAVTVNANGMVSAGVVTAAAGSAAVPAFGFSTDGNSGMYSIGADQVGIAANGTLAFTVNTNGVIAAGTISGTKLYSTGMVSGTGSDVVLDGTELKYAASSLRFKRNVSDLERDSSVIYRLKLRSFDWRAPDFGTTD
jgi:hypothetical protein